MPRKSTKHENVQYVIQSRRIYPNNYKPKMISQRTMKKERRAAGNTIDYEKIKKEIQKETPPLRLNLEMAKEMVKAHLDPRNANSPYALHDRMAETLALYEQTIKTMEARNEAIKENQENINQKKKKT